LGVNGPVTTDNSQRLLAAMFSEYSEPLDTGLSERWDKIRLECYELVPLLFKEFIDRCACFQGVGKIPLAINFINLHRLFKKISFYANIDMENLNRDFEIHLRQKQLKRALKSLEKERLERPVIELKNHLSNWAKSLRTILGDNFDKDLLLEELDQITKIIKKEGTLWPHQFEQRKLTLLEKNFGESSAKDLLNNLAVFNSVSNEITEIIPILTKFDPVVYNAVDTFSKEFNLFIRAVERKVADQMQEYEEYDSSPVIDQIKEFFEEISSDLLNLSRRTNGTYN